MTPSRLVFFFFFFNDPAPTEIYTLSLHDALPISCRGRGAAYTSPPCPPFPPPLRDRKSTRLNSSHGYISYAVFCLKKKHPTRTGPNQEGDFFPPPTSNFMPRST